MDKKVPFIGMTEMVLVFGALHFSLLAFCSFNLFFKKRKRSEKVLKCFITRGRSGAIAETGKLKAKTESVVCFCACGDALK